MGKLDRVILIFGVLIAMVVICALSTSAMAGLLKPKYETVYHHTPPETDQGRMCVMQCQNTKSMCIQNAQLAQQNCQLLAQQKVATCRTKADADYETCVDGGSEYCFKAVCVEEYCPLNTNQCDSAFDTCFEICGGVITSETVCVKRCPEEPQE